MEKRTVGLIAILAIVIFAVIAIAGLGIDIGIGGGYKVVVSGEVSKDALYGGYKCTVNTDYLPDPGVLSMKPAWFWDSKDVVVAVELIGEKTYKSEVSIGSINLILGGSKSYNVEVRHVPVGDYVGIVTVYEIDKSIFGLGWETSRSVMTTKSFSLKIEEIEW